MLKVSSLVVHQGIITDILRCHLVRLVFLSENPKKQSHSVQLDVPDSGLAALVRLSNGDMRKALNILQSTHMASQKITEEAVYLCTGNPLPKDIEQISYWLLNESFAESFKLYETKTRKGLALIDIVREVTMFVFKIKMPSDVRVQLINNLADIEYRLSFGCNDKLQLGSFIAIFTKARSALVASMSRGYLKNAKWLNKQLSKLWPFVAEVHTLAFCSGVLDSLAVELKASKDFSKLYAGIAILWLHISLNQPSVAYGVNKRGACHFGASVLGEPTLERRTC
ncbi:hypothetical protein PVK06_040888 [Gossypium arboreum]|uniref:Replication factor C C-terminal domain-containing protein n=1 Tax=Gossypium arboreum TaxID=29729 RepID=A0ABR0N8V8_GOSAR|nr:hypothetical protein PVK06_040888 [Gossypium arboreum]